MKANEFVKKFGVGAAKNILHGMDDASEFTAHMPEDAWDKPTLIDAVGLRRLVESHELVEQFGGLEKAMDAVINQEANGRPMNQLAQAIADVESCMEVPSESN